MEGAAAAAASGLNIQQLMLQFGISGLLLYVFMKIAFAFIDRWHKVEDKRTDEMSKGFSSVNAKVDQTHLRIDGVDDRIDEVHVRVTSINTKIDTIMTLREPTGPQPRQPTSSTPPVTVVVPKPRRLPTHVPVRDDGGDE